MTTILDEIIVKKREHVVKCKTQTPEAEVLEKAKSAPAPRGFFDALKRKKRNQEAGLIAEVKKASPSKGIIRDDFNPVACAKAYEDGGATCLSVLTDVPYFQGSDDYIAAIKQSVELPVLRKDFMVDPYQIVESRMLDADCILLILAALDDVELHELEEAAIEHNMSVLLEVHNQQELDRALQCKSPLVGINNRNLHDFSVTLDTTYELIKQIPNDYLIVSESGIYTHQDMVELMDHGVFAMLVGESLMRESDILAATARLLGK